MEFYGSFENRLLENTVQPVPVVGMGATQVLYSDLNAYTIVEVSDKLVNWSTESSNYGKIERQYPKWIKVKQDLAELVEGSFNSKHQVYEFSPNPHSLAKTLIWHGPSGLYREQTIKYVATGDSSFIKKEYMTTNKNRDPFVVGIRKQHEDPYF